MFEPIPIGSNVGPGDYALPVAYCYPSGSEPKLSKYWQWIAPQSGTMPGYWALIYCDTEAKNNNT